MEPDPVPIRPAATVIPIRQRPTGLEVLVLQRDANLAFHGGSWVFPGGRVDDREIDIAHGDEVAAARTAARREAFEEAGLLIDESSLVELSHWTTPEGPRRRFSTWFFVAEAPKAQVVVDDGEIRAYQWQTIESALRRCDAGELFLAGPTYVSLLRLRPFATVSEALVTLRSRPNEVFLPRVIHQGDRRYSVLQDDPAYESGDLTLAGPRHRIEHLATGYRYVNDRNPASCADRSRAPEEG